MNKRYNTLENMEDEKCQHKWVLVQTEEKNLYKYILVYCENCAEYKKVSLST